MKASSAATNASNSDRYKGGDRRGDGRGDRGVSRVC